MQLQIRVLNPSDAGAYREVRLRSLKEHPDAFLTTYELEKERPVEAVAQRLQASEHQFTLGCFANGSELAGTVTFVRESNPKTAHKGNVYAMYVAPEFRGNKAGLALLRELIDRAKRCKGLEQINLTVISGNIPAKKLYESVGFVVYGTERNALRVNGRYLDEDLMVLRLAP